MSLVDIKIGEKVLVKNYSVVRSVIKAEISCFWSCGRKRTSLETKSDV